MESMADRRPGRCAAAILVALTVGGSAVAQTSGRAVQCWTDDRGQRSCGDTVAPSEARRQRELVNPRGVVKQIIPAQKTPEQIAEENRLREAQKKQQDYDRYLLQSFQSVEEIQKVRDERLAALEGRLTLAEKAVTDNTRVLEDLRSRGTPADDDPAAKSVLAGQIRDYSQTLEESRAAVARITRERASLNDQFARDMLRYQELRDAARGSVPR